MTAQAEERISTPVKILQAPPLSFSPIKVLTPAKASFEPLHLSPWCNQTRPARPPTNPVRTRIRPQVKAGSSSPECLYKAQPKTIMPGSIQWRTDSSPSKSTLNPSASEFVPKTYKPKPVHNPLGGKLALVAAGFFERAYGLNGQPRVEHTTLKDEMMALTGCSERAVQAVLYGSSYSDLLDGLRAKVPGYVVQKDMTQDFTLLPFFHFDGNAQNTSVDASRGQKATTSYSTIALFALAAILPLTFLC
jgi:hypothetical protein